MMLIKVLDTIPPTPEDVNDGPSPDEQMDFWDGHIDIDPTMLEPPENVLNPGEVHMQKHPFVNTPPVVRPHIARPQATLPLYWPFKTQQEYKQAALFIKTGSSISAIDEQLKILHDIPGGHSTIGYKNAEELHKQLDLPSQFDESKVMTIFSLIFTSSLIHATVRSVRGCDPIRRRGVCPYYVQTRSPWCHREYCGGS
jgi:hypothetical protein